MRRLLREPLLHFLVLGAALFGLYGWLNQDSASKPTEIVVSSGQIEHLAATFAKVWQRPPTADELKSLIDGYVKEEILSREAIGLGLDRNDTVIRRRLQQKMEFLAEDFAAAVEPTDDELEQYFAEHPDDFRLERRVSFRQAFLSPEKRGDRLEADAAQMLEQLRRSAIADTDGLGDALLLPAEIVGQPTGAVAAQFGEEFAAAVDKLDVGVWSGPVRSGYGAHLVLVTQRSGGRMPELAEVREQVKRELANERRLAANRKFLDDLLAKYRVSVEWARSASGAEEARDACAHESACAASGATQ